MCSYSSEWVNSGIYWMKAQKHHSKYYWMEWEIKEEANYEAWEFFMHAITLLLTLAFFLERIFYALISLNLMLTWVKMSLPRFFLLTEDCFDVNFKDVVLKLTLCFRQTDFLLPTQWTCPSSLGIWKFSVNMTWRHCVGHSTYIRWGALGSE